ncbi:unnamed protein product, partial [Medioppia subpectinata]
RYSATPFDDLTSDPCFKQTLVSLTSSAGVVPSLYSLIDKCSAETFIATKVIIQNGIEYMNLDMCKEHPYKQGQTECKTTVPTDPVVDLINDTCFKKITKYDEMCVKAIVPGFNLTNINTDVGISDIENQCCARSVFYDCTVTLGQTHLIKYVKI